MHTTSLAQYRLHSFPLINFNFCCFVIGIWFILFAQILCEPLLSFSCVALLFGCYVITEAGHISACFLLLDVWKPHPPLSVLLAIEPRASATKPQVLFGDVISRCRLCRGKYFNFLMGLTPSLLSAPFRTYESPYTQQMFLKQINVQTRKMASVIKR